MPFLTAVTLMVAERMVRSFLTLMPPASSPTAMTFRVPLPLMVRELFFAWIAAPSPSAAVSPTLSETSFTVPSAMVRIRSSLLSLKTMAAEVWLSRVWMVAPARTIRTVPSTFFATSTAPFKVPVSTYVPAALTVSTFFLNSVPAGALSAERVERSISTAPSSLASLASCSSEIVTVSLRYSDADVSERVSSTSAAASAFSLSVTVVAPTPPSTDDEVFVVVFVPEHATAKTAISVSIAISMIHLRFIKASSFFAFLGFIMEGKA